MIACTDLENVSWSGGVSMDTGVCGGGSILFSVILLNFTMPSMGNFSFSLELRMQRSFFLE